jgi:hypothetical protein
MHPYLAYGPPVGPYPTTEKRTVRVWGAGWGGWGWVTRESQSPATHTSLFLRVINMSLRSLAVAMAATAVVARNNLARTPPMGW